MHVYQSPSQFSKTDSSSLIMILYDNVVTNLCARGNVVDDETKQTLDRAKVSSNSFLKVRKKSQCRKYLKNRGISGEALFDVMYKLQESWIRVIKSVAKQHVHGDVGRTRCNQLSHAKGTTLLLSHFVDHLFHFHQDPCLHHTLSESEMLQDRQTELMMATKLRVVVRECNSLRTTAKRNHKLRDH